MGKLLLNFFVIGLVLQISIVPVFAGSKRQCFFSENIKTQYKVKDGDYIIKILQDFNLFSSWSVNIERIEQIAKENKIKNPDLIYPGEVVILPVQCQSVAQTAKKTLDRKPSSELPPQESQSFSPYSVLSIFGTYNFYRIDSISSTSSNRSILLSTPSPGVKIGWGQFWSSQIRTGIQIHYESVKMYPASTGTLISGKHDLGGAEFYFSYLPSDKFEIKFYGAYDGWLFARSPQAGTAALDKIYQAQYGVVFLPTLVQKGNLLFGMELGLGQVLATSVGSYTIENSTSYRIAPIIKQKLKDAQIEMKLEYETNTQKSNISQQKNRELGMQIGVSFEVGK